jgi:hypothetical protein
LFSTKVLNEEYLAKKLQKRIDEAVYFSQVQLQQKLNIIDQYVQVTAVLDSMGTISFFETRDNSLTRTFEIEGCVSDQLCEVVGTTLRLQNKLNQECIIQTSTEKGALNWQQEIIAVASHIKVETDTALHRMSSAAKDNDDEDGNFVDASDTSFSTVKLQFEFKAPRVSLQLNTTGSNGEAWQLVTALTDIRMKASQMEHVTEVSMNVGSLRVKDNSGDLRYPYIFENVTSQGQQELASFILKQIKRDTPLYEGVDTYVKIGFGALHMFWKPRAMA